MQPKQEIAVPSLSDVASALPLFLAALALELAVSYLLLRHWKLEAGILKYVLAANIVSIPAVWTYCFAAAPFFIDWQGSVGRDNFSLIFFIIMSAEAFAVAFEAFAVHHFNRKKITLEQAAWMALAANAASFMLSPGLIGNGSLGWLFLLALAFLLFPFLAANALPGRLGMKKASVWRLYAAQLIAYAAWIFVITGQLSSLGAIVEVGFFLAVEFVALLLLNPGISKKNAALLEIGMLLSVAAGLVLMAALAFALSAASAAVH
jgi:hypothetical protein